MRSLLLPAAILVASLPLAASSGVVTSLPSGWSSVTQESTSFTNSSGQSIVVMASYIYATANPWKCIVAFKVDGNRVVYVGCSSTVKFEAYNYAQTHTL